MGLRGSIAHYQQPILGAVNANSHAWGAREQWIEGAEIPGSDPDGRTLGFDLDADPLARLPDPLERFVGVLGHAQPGSFRDASDQRFRVDDGARAGVEFCGAPNGEQVPGRGRGALR
ncbi:MAG: hypothetical protein BWY63_03512 [Chloroflexi bacterium ADurb.Bin360]|nr:MAG: hypothetical protein BWY63_03512 [Chloroflexi bacterium ADurb.Bin360]